MNQEVNRCQKERNSSRKFIKRKLQIYIFFLMNENTNLWAILPGMWQGVARGITRSLKPMLR